MRSTCPDFNQQFMLFRQQFSMCKIPFLQSHQQKNNLLIISNHSNTFNELPHLPHMKMKWRKLISNENYVLPVIRTYQRTSDNHHFSIENFPFAYERVLEDALFIVRIATRCIIIGNGANRTPENEMLLSA